MRIVALAILFVAISVAWADGETYSPGQAINQDFSAIAQPFLRSYCFDCHSGNAPEADLSLEALGSLDETNAAIWKSVWAQVTLQEMPY